MQDPTPEQLTDEFRAALTAAHDPRIEDFLARAAPKWRCTLFAELLTLEVAHRLAAGELVLLRDYLDRFPEEADAIRSALDSRETPTLVRGSAVRVRCPHCHQPIELVADAELSDVSCSTCGSSFNLLSGKETVARSDRPGGSVGHFELREKLGAGAFGAVWKAWDTTLDRVVAVKIPRASALSVDEREKFFREARAAAQLQHENIVRVFEVGRDGETIYIVSELVEGLTLEEWLSDQQPTPREAAELTRTVAQALHHAHTQGVIHRDIKPSNVLLDSDLKPHVADFGLAKREAGEVTMTVSGAILGTPAYMSPEQARGDAHLVDARSDIYSCGVMLFELLTGERPFRGNTRMLLHQVVGDEPPSLRKLSAAVPRDLETVCLKCLEKDPARRYQSAADLASDLERYLEGRAITARPVSPAEHLWRWSKRNAALASTLLAVVLLLTVLGIGGPLVAWQQAELRRDADDAKEQLAGTVEELTSTTGTLRTTVAQLRDANAATSRAKANLEDSLSRERATTQELNRTVTELDAAKQQAEPERRAAEEGRTTALRQLTHARVAQADAALQAGDHAAANRVLDAVEQARRDWGHAYLRRLASGSLLTFASEQGDVTAATFSPDGTRVAVAWGDRSARVLDLATGQELITLGPLPSYPKKIAWSPDGTRLVTAGARGDAKAWDAKTGKHLFDCQGHRIGANSVAFSPDGSRLVTGGADDVAKVWDAQTGKEILSFRKHGADVNGVCFSPDGSKVVSGSHDKTVRVWDAQTGEELFVCRGHDATVFPVAWSPDGGVIASAGGDDNVRLWDAQTGEPLRVCRGHEWFIRTLAFTPDGRSVVSGGMRGTLRIWDVRTGAQRDILRGHSDAILSVDVSRDGSLVVTGSMDGTFKVWDLTGGFPNPVFRSHTTDIAGDDVHCVTFSPDGSRFLTGGNDKTVLVCDTATRTPLFRLEGHTWHVSAGTFTPDGGRIITASWDRTIRVWDAKTGQQLRMLTGHEQPIRDMSLSADGTRLATISADKTARLWDVESGEELRNFTGHRFRGKYVALSPDGTRVVGGDERGNLILWDAETGAPLRSREKRESFSGVVTFTPDGSLLAAGGPDATILLLDPDSFEVVRRLKGHAASAVSLAFNADGSRLASGSFDGSMKLWDVATGEELISLRGHGSRVTDVAFSPDGRLLLSASEDGSARLWESGPAPDSAELLQSQRQRLATWHMNEADTAENARNWFAARVHLRALLEADPENEMLRRRFTVIDNLWHSERSKNPLPP